MRPVPGLMLPILGLLMLLLISCGGGAEPTATLQPTFTPTPVPTLTSTPRPTPTPVIVEPTPTPRATATPSPTATSTPLPTATPEPTPTMVPTPTPEPPPPSTPTTTPRPIPQPKELSNTVASSGNLAVRTSTYSISGTASPDATVSANGQLATVEPSGSFETNIPLIAGPNLIEIVASDLSGIVLPRVITVVLTETANEEALFGQVLDVVGSSLGVVDITLDTTEGVQRVGTTLNTRVEFPGRDRFSAADISQGDSLAILAGESGGQLQALSILVKPPAPVFHSHVSGAVLQAAESRITIMDRHGNVITADLSPTAGEFFQGNVVTAALRHDPKTGSLTVMGTEEAERSLERLVEAFRLAITAGARDNQENLGQRLIAATSGHLTTLQEYVNRGNPAATFILAQAIGVHGSTLSGFGLGAPTLTLSGAIQTLNTVVGAVVVAPREGSPVPVNLTGATAITLFGVDSRIESLVEGQLLNQRIHSLYEPRTRDAITFDVIFPSLDENLEAALLPQVLVGELEGTVGATDVDAEPPTLTVRPDPDRTVAVSITPETAIRVRGQFAGLQQLVPGTRVKVRYNPDNLEALEVETFDLSLDQRFTAGVVTSVIPKFGRDFPGERGNISIATPDGGTVFLTVTDATIIEHNGLRMNILAVKLGDVVRPVSSYSATTGELQRLVLRTPALTGTVRGKLTAPSGREYVTIATDGTDLMTLQVSPSADITKLGTAVGLADLEVGAQIESGLFNPVSLQVTRLEVGLPKTFQARGSILGVNQETGVILVRISATESVQVILPFKPGILFIDGREGSIRDLEVGDTVQVVYYRPNRVVVRIFVTSG